MQTSVLEIKKLKPAEYNPRSISERALEGLKVSIREFGQVENLIVNKDMTVISGHQRLKAMQELGFVNVMCYIVDLDKTREKQLNVVMNSQSISGDYDNAKLSLMLDELKLEENYEALLLHDLEPLNLDEEEDEEDGEILTERISIIMDSEEYEANIDSITEALKGIDYEIKSS